MSTTSAGIPGEFKYRKMQTLAKQRGLTNRSIAKAVQANQGTVGRWAKGDAAPSPKFIARLAELLEVDPSELYVVTETERNLSYYRVLAGYSLAQLAPLLGTSPVHLGRMEAGRSAISPATLDKLRQHLNLDEDKMAKAVLRSQMHRRQPTSEPFELIPAAPPARHLIGA